MTSGRAVTSGSLGVTSGREVTSGSLGEPLPVVMSLPGGGDWGLVVKSLPVARSLPVD